MSRRTTNVYIKAGRKRYYLYSFFEVRTGERKTVAHRFKILRKLCH
jgi:hypothetical protein